MIVLGSYPIQSLLGRVPGDIDLLGTLTEFQSYTQGRPVILDNGHAVFKTKEQIYDCELIWPDSLSAELMELILNDPATYFIEDIKAYAPSLNVLYMLKMTHRFKKNSPHFYKTLSDIRVMRAAGAEIQPEHLHFYLRRLKATLHYEHPNLNRTKEEFFNPEDDFYVYDHDSIHEAVALGERPAYWEYAIDGKEVLSSKKKFFEGSQEMRLRGVYEETCVLALERSQIPNEFNGRISEHWSFLKALEKVCTSITSGWFREFAWENYDQVLMLHRQSGSYVERFNANKDKLRPYERPMV